MQLYNTLTRKKEPFVPLAPPAVRLYACGITPYDFCHIGHARSAIVFDVLVRYLKSKDYEVLFVRNFTDIDDKIIKRAQENNEPVTALTERFIEAFYDDMDRLGVLRADIEPKATEHVPEMLALVQQLVDSGHAYAVPSGDVYFRVRSFPEYARLSGRDIDAMRAGARVEPGKEKEDPLDFTLWKAAKPGEPTWDSPWGPGRPGWHLECSAMTDHHLKLPFDIHGGGQDLIFPHHENEIAQSQAATGKQMARFWVHNGFVQVDNEKMSKSLGNFSTIRDIMQSYLPETLRYVLLTRHYRSPVDFTLEAMAEAEKNLRRIYTLREHIHTLLDRGKWSGTALPDEITDELANNKKQWEAAMADDMNTAAALGHVFGLVRLAGRIAEKKAWRTCEGGREALQDILDTFSAWGTILGVFTQDPKTFLSALNTIKIQRANIDTAQVEALLEKRTACRADKDFAGADAIREELTAMGIEIHDTPQGQQWDVI